MLIREEDWKEKEKTLPCEISNGVSEARAKRYVRN